MLLIIHIYGLAIYEYGEHYGFRDQINPLTIIAGSAALIDLAGWIGQYLNNKDTKQGYGENGISDKSINAYREAQQNGESKDYEDYP